MDGLEAASAYAIRKFDEEAKWKDTLDSKALSLLGFNGIFVSILATVSVTLPGTTEALSLYDNSFVPIALQIVSVLLLLWVIGVFGIETGPNVVDLFRCREQKASSIVEQTMIMYIWSLLENRVAYAARCIVFTLALLFTAASIVQLSVPYLVLSCVGINEASLLVLLKFVPALIVVLAAGVLAWSGHSSYLAGLKIDLTEWADYYDATFEDPDSPEEVKHE